MEDMEQGITSVHHSHDPLSPAERKVVFLMRNLQPYDKIEIKLKDHELGNISVVSTSTTKEDFPDT